MTEKQQNRIKLGLILLTLLVGIVLFQYFSPARIRALMEGFGAWGPILYVLLFAVLPIFLFPVPLLVLPAGILFGVFWGSVYTMVAVFFNTVIMYYFGRFLAKDLVNRLIDTKIPESIRPKLRTENQTTLFMLFFILRLVPLVSYNLINYVAPLTEIKFWRYILATMLGVLPGVIVFINTGDKSLNVGSSSFTISLVLMALLIISSFILLRVYLKRSRND